MSPSISAGPPDQRASKPSPPVDPIKPGPRVPLPPRRPAYAPPSSELRRAGKLTTPPPAVPKPPVSKPAPPMPKPVSRPTVPPIQLVPPPAPKPVTPLSAVPAAPPAAAKPTPSVSALGEKSPEPVAIPAVSDLAFRTMEDDLTALRKGEPAPSIPPPLATKAELPMPIPPSAPVKRPAPLASAPAPTAPASAAFPLPPKKGAKPVKIVLSPPMRGTRRILRPLFLLATLLLIVGGTAVAVWYLWPLLPFGGGGDEAGLIVQAETILPINALAIVEYTVTTSEDRAALTSAWSVSDKPVSFSGLFSGDPRYLLTEPDITHWFYVALENDPRLYVVAPHTQGLASLTKDTFDAAVTERDGWIIMSQLSTDPYIAALGNGTWPVISPSPFAVELGDPVIQAILPQTLLAQLRGTLAGELGKSTDAATLILNGTLNPDGTSLALTAAHVAPVEASASPALVPVTVDPTFLSRIPGDATFVHLGVDVSQAIAAYPAAAVAGHRDAASFLALTSQLTGPYAFYSRVGADRVQDFGFIIPLPATLTTSLQLGDPVLEDGIQALAPLLLKQEAVATAAFTSVTYQETPLRYVNLAGPSVSIDYALVNNQLLIATSKEGMYALIDTVAARAASVEASDSWKGFLSAWGALPTTNNLSFGSLAGTVLQPLLQPQATFTPLFGLAAGEATSSSGIVQLAPAIAPVATEIPLQP